MQPVFLDTAGLVALLNKDDQYHTAASELFHSFGKQGRQLVTTSLVFGEVGNVLARTDLRSEAAWLIDSLQEEPSAKVVYVDRSLMEGALRLYRSRPDKKWGLVDCSSFVLMNAMQISDAFTADHHFEQAGFQRLLR